MSSPCKITWERKLREQGQDPYCEECELFLASFGKREMSEAARELGVKTLTSFASSSLESQARHAQAYGYISQQLPEQWFEAADALETAYALLHYLRYDSASLRLFYPWLPEHHEYFVAGMTSALEVVAAALEEAHARGVRFHFIRE